MTDEQSASSWEMRCTGCGKWDSRTRTLDRNQTIRFGKQLGWTVEGQVALCPECR